MHLKVLKALAQAPSIRVACLVCIHISRLTDLEIHEVHDAKCLKLSGIKDRGPHASQGPLSPCTSSSSQSCVLSLIIHISSLTDLELHEVGDA